LLYGALIVNDGLLRPKIESYVDGV